jgi:hypothetical protein
MAGYVPTDLSVRFGRAFQGNPRIVRGATRTLIVATVAVLWAAASPAHAQQAPQPQVSQVPIAGCERAWAGGTRPPGLGSVERATDPANVELDGTVIVSPERFVGVSALEPGMVVDCVLAVRSRRSEPASYELVPLGVLGSRAPNAGYEFLDRSDDRWAQTAGGWIDLAVDTIVIPPRGVARIPFRITVPADPPGGSAFAAVGTLSRTSTDTGDTSLGVETIVASLVLLQLPGEASPDLRLREVQAPRLRWERESWTLAAFVDNDGNLQGATQGRVRLRSIFGNEVASLGVQTRTILPGGRERIEATWDRVPWIGLYRWDLRVATDEPRASATARGWFVALPPWWVLAIVGAALLVLLAHTVIVRRDPSVDEADHEFPDDPGA